MNIITYTESREITEALYIDVRTPHEFDLDHVPGAVNIPLFEDNERAEVGTLYRMAGRDNAVVRGTEIVGGKLKVLVSAFMAYKERNIVLYCARGGMRSGSIAALLDSLGMTIYRLDTGYKGYRRYVRERLDSLNIRPRLFVLQGLTGSGKTEIIKRINRSIDLEGMAGHRSSLFGGLGLKQNTQKGFESRIVEALDRLKNADYVVIEGESRKIGNLHLPERLHKAMQESPVVLINASMEKRIDVIYNEYASHCDSVNVPEILKALTAKLGQETITRLQHLYREGDLRGFIQIMLEKYYDPLYRYSLDRKEYIGSIEHIDTVKTVEAVENLIQDYLDSETTKETG